MLMDMCLAKFDIYQGTGAKIVLKATQILHVLIFFKKKFFLMSGLKFIHMYYYGERTLDFVISCYLVLLYSIVTCIFF